MKVLFPQPDGPITEVTEYLRDLHPDLLKDLVVAEPAAEVPDVEDDFHGVSPYFFRGSVPGP